MHAIQKYISPYSLELIGICVIYIHTHTHTVMASVILMANFMIKSLKFLCLRDKMEKIVKHGLKC